MSAYNSAVSGLLAQSVVIGARAQNIANAGVTGKPNPGPGDRVAYQPVDAVLISNEGSVAASLVSRNPATDIVYDPDSGDADESGLVAVPNVSLEDEVVGLLVSKNAYAADAKVISVQRQLDKDLLDIIA